MPDEADKTASAEAAEAEPAPGPGASGTPPAKSPTGDERSAEGHSVLEAPADGAATPAANPMPYREFDLEGVDFDTLEADDSSTWSGASAFGRRGGDAPQSGPAAPDHGVDHDAATALLGEGGSTLDLDDLSGDVALFDLDDLESMDIWQPTEIPSEDLQGITAPEDEAAFATPPGVDQVPEPAGPPAEEYAGSDVMPADESPEPGESLPEEIETLDQLVAPAEGPPDATETPLPVVPEPAGIPAPVAQEKPEQTERADEPILAEQADQAEPAAPPQPAGMPDGPAASVPDVPPAAAPEGTKGMASEAVRVLEDLKRMGVDGAAEALSGAPAPPRPTAPKAPPAAAKAPEARAPVSAPGRSPPPAPAEAGPVKRTGPSRPSALQRALTRAASVLILLDRPFAKVSPRLKGFLGQMAVSMLATAVCLLILSHLGLLPQ